MLTRNGEDSQANTIPCTVWMLVWGCRCVGYMCMCVHVPRAQKSDDVFPWVPFIFLPGSVLAYVYVIHVQ